MREDAVKVIHESKRIRSCLEWARCERPYLTIAALLTAVVFGLLNAQDAVAQEEGTMQEKQLDVQHPVKLNYLLSLPEGYSEQEQWPLVLFLHGAGERGDDVSRVKVHGPPKLVAAGKKLPFVLVAPQCPADRWWEPISLTALLDEIESEYKIDPDRIYVTGLSMGGFGTWSLGAHSPERFAALAPICGGGDAFVVPRRIRDRIPCWIFHGARDRVVPLNQSVGMYEAFADLNADVRLTVYPDAGHDSWTETYDNPEFYDWLLSQNRNASEQSASSN